MKRLLARIAVVDRIASIPKAETIECAYVGGWPVCVKIGEFTVGERAVYVEIDTFLPEGKAEWQHLIDNTSLEVDGVRGHRLRSVKLRGQLSQGLLLPLSVLPESLQNAPVNTDVAEALGVFKYVEPLPEDLLATASGYRPGNIPSSSLPRVQNLEAMGLLRHMLAPIDGQPAIFQVSEKLEGQETHYAVLEDKLNVFSADLGFKDIAGNPRWDIAHDHNIEEALKAISGNFVLSGELIGPKTEGNIYRLDKHRFLPFNALNIHTGELLSDAYRKLLCDKLGLMHAPVLHTGLAISQETSARELLALADGPSVINPGVRREGLVLRNVTTGESMKVISDAYLLGEKLDPNEPLLRELGDVAHMEGKATKKPKAPKPPKEPKPVRVLTVDPKYVQMARNLVNALLRTRSAKEKVSFEQVGAFMEKVDNTTHGAYYLMESLPINGVQQPGAFGLIYGEWVAATLVPGEAGPVVSVYDPDSVGKWLKVLGIPDVDGLMANFTGDGRHLPGPDIKPRLEPQWTPVTLNVSIVAGSVASAEIYALEMSKYDSQAYYVQFPNVESAEAFLAKHGTGCVVGKFLDVLADSGAVFLAAPPSY